MFSFDIMVSKMNVSIINAPFKCEDVSIAVDAENRSGRGNTTS